MVGRRRYSVELVFPVGVRWRGGSDELELGIIGTHVEGEEEV